MNFKKRLSEVKKEIRDLNTKIEKADSEELDNLSKNLEDLTSEAENLRKKIALQEKARALIEDNEYNAPASEFKEEVRTVAKSGENPEDKKAESKKERYARIGKELISGRTAVLDNTNLLPDNQSTTIQPYQYNQASTIVDLVRYLPVLGGETFKMPYAREYDEADYSDAVAANGSGGEYHDVSGPTFGYSTINKTKITAYNEISEEFEKTPVADYAMFIENNISKSIRNKIAREVVIGDGGSGHFTGIMSATLNDKETVQDYKLGEINENTLDEIVLNYGGEEDIEARMSLLLNKRTLLNFTKVRGANKNRVYNVNYDAGTIDGIRFITTSKIKAFDNATAGDESMNDGRGDAFAAYGNFNDYAIAVFSNIETAKSVDYKFKQGITAYRGSVFLGGNVIGYKTFMRIYKGADTVTELVRIPNSNENKVPNPA